MRISEEIDALEVMGVPPITFLCASRLLGAWVALPFIYLVGIGVMYLASYLSVVKQVADGLIRRLHADLLDVPGPHRPHLQPHQGDGDGDRDRAVGCYYGYTASGGPVGVGTATAKSMAFNIVAVHIIGMVGTIVFWGANPRLPIGG